MNKYFVSYLADTNFSFKHRKEHVKGSSDGFIICFSDMDTEVFIYEKLKKIEDKFVFQGIAFDSYVMAVDYEKAQSKMEGIVFRILDILAFISQSPWVNSSLQKIYEADISLKEKHSKFYFYSNKDVEILKSIRVLDINVLSEVLKKLDGNKFRDNIFASLHNLNKGFVSDTDVDEFLSYWIAIEYLSHSLNEKADYKKEERFHECPICGKSLSLCCNCGETLPKKIMSPGNFKRVEEIALQKLSVSKKEFQKIIEIRAIIIHGGKWESLNLVYKYKDLVRKLLIFCLGDLLDLNEDNFKLILDKIPIIRNKITSGVSIVYDTEICGLDKLPNISEPTKQPHISISKNEIITSIDDNGVINMSTTNSYLHQAEKGISFNKIAYSVYIHKGSGIKEASINNQLKVIKKS